MEYVKYENSPPRENGGLKGFTLAEVLITLVIIGVIAAITVPSLMNNTNAQEYKSAFKKSISVLNQALTLNYALEGLSANDYTSAEAVTNMFKSRMNIMTAYNPPVYTNTAANLYGLIPAAVAVESISAGFVKSPEAIEPSITVPEEDEPVVSGGETAGSTNNDTPAETTGTFTNTDVCSGTNVWVTADGAVFCVGSNYSSDNDDSQTSVCNSNSTVACSSDGEPNLFIDVNGYRKPNKLTTSSNRPRDIYSAMIYAQKVIPYGDAAQQVMYDKQVSASE